MEITKALKAISLKEMTFNKKEHQLINGFLNDPSFIALLQKTEWLTGPIDKFVSLITYATYCFQQKKYEKKDKKTGTVEYFPYLVPASWMTESSRDAAKAKVYQMRGYESTKFDGAFICPHFGIYDDPESTYAKIDHPELKYVFTVVNKKLRKILKEKFPTHDFAPKKAIPSQVFKILKIQKPVDHGEESFPDLTPKSAKAAEEVQQAAEEVQQAAEEAAPTVQQAAEEAAPTVQQAAEEVQQEQEKHVKLFPTLRELQNSLYHTRELETSILTGEISTEDAATLNDLLCHIQTATRSLACAERQFLKMM
jgi:DNA repair exonuclease SbcCD ATPase subunit